jgi:hypothetical protein
VGLSVTRTALLLAGLLAGCAPATDAPRFSVRAVPPALELANRDTAPVYFTVFEHQTAMVVRWAPCRDPSQCRSVAGGAEVRLPFDSITGYEPGATAAILYWWQLRPDSSGGLAHDSVRSVNLTLAPPRT